MIVLISRFVVPSAKTAWPLERPSCAPTRLPVASVPGHSRAVHTVLTLCLRLPLNNFLAPSIFHHNVLSATPRTSRAVPRPLLMSRRSSLAISA